MIDGAAKKHDAKLIVTAVNSYAPMLALLRVIQARIKSLEADSLEADKVLCHAQFIRFEIVKLLATLEDK